MVATAPLAKVWAVGAKKLGSVTPDMAVTTLAGMTV